ncbi:hypothetical protein FAVG1_06904 [Fusarium avenaceum]|nr:hypothetical protein FAVG1_06904 [Fusarium avenaceum]
MAPPDVSETESPYRIFRVNPNDEFIGEEDEFIGEEDEYNHDRVVMTMTDRDGSILYEMEGLPLLQKIIYQNDVGALQQYFTIAPHFAPKLPNGEEEIIETTDDFQLAVQSGSLDVLQWFLNNAPRDTVSTQPIRFTTRGFQLLNEAARYGRIETVKFLLAHQPLYANIQDRDNKGCTAILSAADVYSERYCFQPSWNEVRLESNEAIINLLLDQGACASDTYVVPYNKETLTLDNVLTLVVTWAGPELIRRLINCGADVHATITKWPMYNGASASGVNALAVACYHANIKAVETLIDCRGAVTAANSFGRNSKLCTPIFELLCKRGGDASIRNNKGQTPLHTLFDTCITNVPIDPAAISVLLANGARVTDPVAGSTLLHIAAGNLWFVDAVSCLLDHGADPTAKDLSQATALHRAASGRLWQSNVRKAEMTNVHMVSIKIEVGIKRSWNRVEFTKTPAATMWR